MSLPRITIVTPSYNQGQYIEETILSVLGQNYPNLEYIIIDGGSKDNSVEIIKKYADSLAYWVSEPDKGQSDAINKGLKKATGDIVAWLNSDDCYTPGTLLQVGQQFAANPNAGIVMGNVVNVAANGSESVYANQFEPVDFMSRVAIHQPGVFWKRELNLRYGYLDPSFYYLMDQELWVRLFFNTRCIAIDQPFARFRIHDEAKTGKNPVGLYYDFRRIFSRLLNSINDKSFKQKAIKLGLYDNEDDVAYQIANEPNKAQLDRIFANNVLNGIMLEYRQGHIATANKLIFSNMAGMGMAQKMAILVKNNLGIGYFKHLMESK